MALEVAGQVGPQLLTDGATQPFRQGRTGAMGIVQVHGRYYETASRKNLFTAYCLSQATSLVGTAMVGLQIWNGSPVANGVNLSLLKLGGLIKVTSASTVALVLAVGTGQVAAPTGQTAATRVGNNFIGAQGPQALALAAGTFTNAPVAMLNLMHNTAAVAASGEDQGFALDLEGSVIIPPQCYAAIAAVGAAVAAAGSDLHAMWEEISV